jgi:hypothetical protein
LKNDTHYSLVTDPTDAEPVLRLKDCLLYFGIPAYLTISILIFFVWVNPSLIGENTHHIAADSDTYMSFARSIRAQENDPFVIASLSSFPNNLWGPVLFGLIFNSTIAIVAMNYAILIFSLWLITKSADIDIGLLLILVFANVTTSISLLSLNKEMLDLLAISLFIYYLARGKRIALVAACLISAIFRYEACVVMLLYLAIHSRWNILRNSRKTTLIAVCIGLSLFLSTFLSGSMTMRLQEVTATSNSGGLLLLLDGLQQHYLFFIAVIPKILDNLFAELISVSHWPLYTLDDPANSFFLLGNNIANLGIIIYLVLKKRFSLRSNLVYCACLSAICMSTAMVIQPRYFYSAYILLCVEGARRLSGNSAKPALRELHGA